MKQQKAVKRNAIERAADAAGGRRALGEAVGVTEQAIYLWVKENWLPSGRVLEVEKACGGAVSRHELRPDLYPVEEGKFSVSAIIAALKGK